MKLTFESQQVSETKIRELFGRQGTVTDVQLKYTADGRFRQFGFVGFKSPEEAETARAYFDNTYVGASKINVQSCSKLGKLFKYKKEIHAGNQGGQHNMVYSIVLITYQ
jgi:RNA recognition motif-containing protein